MGSHPSLRLADTLHQTILDIATERSQSDLKLGSCLLEAQRMALHVALGYGSFAEYVERLFGFTRRQTEERLRVARALDGLPNMARTLGDGSLSWSAVRELTRVATDETEAEWIEEAQTRTVREIERILIAICSSHHSAVHEGALVIRGTYSHGFSFEHADGSSYGNRGVSPARARVMATTLSALVGMGFRQKEAQAVYENPRVDMARQRSPTLRL